MPMDFTEVLERIRQLRQRGRCMAQIHAMQSCLKVLKAYMLNWVLDVRVLGSRPALHLQHFFELLGSSCVASTS